MASVKILMVLWHYAPTYDEAPPSRFLHIFLHLRRFFPDLLLLMRYDEQISSLPDQIITVRPIIPISGNYSLFKGILFRLQMLIHTIGLIIQKKERCVLLRGYECIILLPFLKLANIHTIYDFHGYWGQELLHTERRPRGILNKYAEKIMLFFSDRIIVVSQGVLAQVKEHEKKCILLPNGVDLDAIRNSRIDEQPDPFAGKFVIGFIGNWEGSMNIEDICDAIHYLQDTIAVIVGRGGNEENLLERYGTDPRILFTGRLSLSRTYALLNRFDVCIIPYNSKITHASYPDYFSTRKGKEYLAAGKPIIVADVIGKEGWLVNEETCLFYTPGDPSDLAKKIRMLQTDKALSSTISRNNLLLSESFSWEGVTNQSGLIEAIETMG